MKALAVLAAAGSVCLSVYLTLAPVWPAAPRPDHWRFVPWPVTALRGEVDCDPDLAAEVARKAASEIWSIRPQTGEFLWPDVMAPLDDLWAGTHIDNQSYELNLHSLFLLRHLIRAHQQNPKPEYLDLGRRIAMSWIRWNGRDDPPCPFSWNDHATANRAISLCAFADYLRACGALDDRFEMAVGNSLYEHGRFLSSPLNYRFRHNHGIFQAEALLVTATHLAAGRVRQRWIRVACRRLEDQLAHTYSATGVHLEDAPCYHLWITELLGRTSDYLTAVDLPIPATLTATLDRARKISPALIMPDEEIVPVGDTPRGRHASCGTAEPGLTIHADAGYASLRNGLYVFFNASNHSWTHKHCDDLAVVVADANGPIITDPGFLNYEPNDTNRLYSLSWEAHSTVTAETQMPRVVSRRCGIDRFAHAGDYACVRGRSERRDGTVHTRWVLYDLAHETIILLDRCEAERPVRWRRRFQFEPDITLAQPARNHLNASTTGQERLHLTLWPAQPGAKVIAGQTEPLQGWVCRPFLDLVPAPMTVETQKGKTACFAAVLTPDRRDVEVFVAADQTIHFTQGNQRTTIRLAADRITVTTHAHPSLSSKFSEGTVSIPLETRELSSPCGKFWPLGWRGRIALIALVVLAWSPVWMQFAARIRRPAVWLSLIPASVALTAALLAVYWPRLCFVF